jgi:hypothetical protein
VSEDLVAQFGDRYDDIGVFDSILLAKPYRAILRLNGDPAALNVQRLDGSELSVAALRATGVRFVVTTTERTDLPLAGSTDEAYLYRVPDPAPRTQFIGAGEVEYSRPSSDEIQVMSQSGQAGSVSLLESYDPGWKADVDGRPAVVEIANGFAMKVPVPAGRHRLRLRYETPGRSLGWILSLVSAGMLAGLLWVDGGGRRSATFPDQQDDFQGRLPEGPGRVLYGGARSR